MKLNARNMRLYAVTARYRAKDDDALLEQVAKAIDGGAGIVQLREKNLEEAQLLALARRFTALCREKGAISIINDRADIAVAADADGAHVGQDDLEALRAREILGPGRILGVSAHTVEEALRAQDAGADYLGVGAAFVTGTKADARPIAHTLYREITHAVEIPVVAIGGINGRNMTELSGSGLAGVAVVSAIFDVEDPEVAARALRERADQVCN